jgi:hypothetical protein
MLFGEIQSDALARLHHWLQEFGVRPCESSAKIQQAFLALFPVCAQPGPWHVLLIFLMLLQGTLPPLRTQQTFRPAGAFSPADQLMLCSVKISVSLATVKV